ncbi:19414_t:CDS:2, partial [Racocetra fulgida]
MSNIRNLETSAPGYNPYKGDSRYISEYETNRESFTTDITSSPENILYPEEVALHRYNSTKNVVPGPAVRKLARGDSVKQIPKLDKFDPTSGFNSSVTVKKPVTLIEKFQSWMINEAFGFTFITARSAALVLHVDAAMILFPVCRNLISVLRATPLNGIIPFDENIEFHKAIGWSLAFFTVVHTVSHWVNFYELAKAQNGGFVMWLQLNFATGPGATGYVMLISLGIMVYTATEKAR